MKKLEENENRRRSPEMGSHTNHSTPSFPLLGLWCLPTQCSWPLQSLHLFFGFSHVQVPSRRPKRRWVFTSPSLFIYRCLLICMISLFFWTGSNKFCPNGLKMSFYLKFNWVFFFFFFPCCLIAIRFCLWSNWLSLFHYHELRLCDHGEN